MGRFVTAERVRETTTTTGTGTLNLGGATAACRTFAAAIGTGNRTRYCLVSADGSNWEIGIGTVTAGSPDTLSRTALLSTNSNALISLAAGTHKVFCSGGPPARPLYSGTLTGDIPTSANTGLTNWGNQSSAVITDGENGLILSGATSGTTISIRYKAVPTPPYNIDVLLERFSLDTNINGAFFGWYDGTNKIEALSLFGQSNGMQIYVLDYATLTSGSGAANVRYTAASVFMNPQQWLRIRDDNAGNILLQVLPFGAAGPAITLYTVAKASGYLGGSGYSNVFFGINRNSGYQAAGLYSYKES